VTVAAAQATWELPAGRLSGWCACQRWYSAEIAEALMAREAGPYPAKYAAASNCSSRSPAWLASGHASEGPALPECNSRDVSNLYSGREAEDSLLWGMAGEDGSSSSALECLPCHLPQWKLRI
jgi:hypothetical protein